MVGDRMADEELCQKVAASGQALSGRGTPTPTMGCLPKSRKRGQAKVHPAGDGASRTLLRVSCLEHSWTEKASGPVSAEV